MYNKIRGKEVLFMTINIKKIILSTMVGFLLLSAISLDVSAAKKSSKLSKEAITEMSDKIGRAHV